MINVRFLTVGSSLRGALWGLACVAFAQPAIAQNAPQAPAPPVAQLAAAPAAPQAQAPIAPCSAADVSTNVPPATSGPLYRCATMVFHASPDWVTEVPSMIEGDTYARLLTIPSQRSQNRWVPYD